MFLSLNSDVKMPKGIRFDISDDLHRRLKIKLASEGRQANELYITLTEIYVGDDEKGKKDRSRSSKKS